MAFVQAALFGLIQSMLSIHNLYMVSAVFM